MPAASTSHGHAAEAGHAIADDQRAHRMRRLGDGMAGLVGAGGGLGLDEGDHRGLLRRQSMLAASLSV